MDQQTEGTRISPLNVVDQNRQRLRLRRLDEQRSNPLVRRRSEHGPLPQRDPGRVPTAGRKPSEQHQLRNGPPRRRFLPRRDRHARNNRASPRRAAARIASSASLVLPMPAGPLKASQRTSPCITSVISPSMRDSSVTRPMNRTGPLGFLAGRSRWVREASGTAVRWVSTVTVGAAMWTRWCSARSTDQDRDAAADSAADEGPARVRVRVRRRGGARSRVPRRAPR